MTLLLALVLQGLQAAPAEASLPAAPKAGAAVIVELKDPMPDVAGIAARLGDIARIEVLGDAKTSRGEALRIGLVEVARFQKDGAVQRVEKAAIRAKVAALGFDAKAISIEGPESVEVRQRRVRIDAARLENAARRHVMESLGSAAPGAEIRLAGGIQPVDIPAGRWRIGLDGRADAGNPRYAGLCRITVDVSIDGEVVERIPVPLLVKRPIDVLRLKRRAPRGRPLAFDDVESVSIAYDGRGGEIVEGLASALGRKPVRQLEAGEVLTDRDLERLPVIAKGDVVTARFKVGSLTIETICRAEQEGAPGQRILLMNLESQKSVQATVVDARTVEVVTP